MEQTNYDILASICQSRKSSRRFSGKSVPDDLVQKIIAIAKTSPYMSGLKNWDIEIVSSKDIINEIAESVNEKSEEMARLMKDDFKEHFLNYAKNFTFFNQAPVLLIPTFRISPVMKGMMGKNATEEIVRWERDSFTKSISCVAMLILLAAEALNLGACYMTGPIVDEENIIKIAHLKRGREIGAIIPIGYKQI